LPLSSEAKGLLDEEWSHFTTEKKCEGVAVGTAKKKSNFLFLKQKASFTAGERQRVFASKRCVKQKGGLIGRGSAKARPGNRGGGGPQRALDWPGGIFRDGGGEIGGGRVGGGFGGGVCLIASSCYGDSVPSLVTRASLRPAYPPKLSNHPTIALSRGRQRHNLPQ